MIRLEVTATVELDPEARTVRVLDSTIDSDAPPAGQDQALFVAAAGLVQRGALLRRWPLTPRELLGAFGRRMAAL